MKGYIPKTALAAAVMAFFVWDVTSLAPSPSARGTGDAKRGEYLVKGGGCGDCHTPKKMDPSGLEPDITLDLAGHPAALVMPSPPKLPEGPWLVIASGTFTAWAGPWGVSFAANITPHKEVGIGAWDEKAFLDTIRNGRVMGRGRPILPPMPVPDLQNLTDDDLKAIYSYLMTLTPNANKVPAPIPPSGVPAADASKAGMR